VKDLLFSIARDTKYNIDLHPGITGRVSLNAVNEPLPSILDRIARQADLRYELNGKTVSVMPDTPYLKTYKVNYVNLSRNTASSIGVASQIAATGSSGIAQASGTTASSGNNSNTSVITTSNNDYWAALKDNLANILYATKIEQKKAEERAAIAEDRRRVFEIQDNRNKDSAKSVSSREQENIRASIPQSTPPQPGDSEREVIINSIAGTVSVFANERQHQLVREYLDTVSNASQRQVLIEATIVEVSLKDQYRAGIDWTRTLQGAIGWSIDTATTGGKNALANALSPFVTATYSGGNGITAAIDLLESFGKTKVLSSPKLMALNNQTALLKVVDNLVYFTVKADTSAPTATAPAFTTFTTTPQTVPVGIVMSVLPQINENGMVSLTVRPTISRNVGFARDPNPSLPASIPNQVPIIQVREMESLLQIRSGQTVILGGLIQDDSNNARDGIPGLSRPEGIGAVFGQHERKNSQTELVIFLRPTVVTDPSLESAELRQFQRLLPNARGAQ
jgi:general secretion pathway protein D